jgi:hypothetical protein
MPQSEGAPPPYQERYESVPPLKPALASINASCDYMGGISRAKFYADVLPLLETVKLGNRNLIVVASMDRLIASRSRASASPQVEMPQLLGLAAPVAVHGETLSSQRPTPPSRRETRRRSQSAAESDAS